MGEIAAAAISARAASSSALSFIPACIAFSRRSSTRVLGILIVERARRGVRVGLVRGVPQHGRELCLEAFLILAPRRVRRARGVRRCHPRPDAASPGGATPEPAAAASSCCLSAAPFACFLLVLLELLPAALEVPRLAVHCKLRGGRRDSRVRRPAVPSTKERRAKTDASRDSSHGAIDAGSRGRFHSSACSRGVCSDAWALRASRVAVWRWRASRLIRDQRSKTELGDTVFSRNIVFYLQIYSYRY